MNISETFKSQNLAPMHQFSLEDQTAIVTGAAGGIGRSLCRSLGAAGAELVLIDIDRDGLTQFTEELRNNEWRATAYECDVSNIAEVQRVIGGASAAHGADVLICCAGINLRMPTMEVDESTYDVIMDTNLKAPFFTSQTVAKYMKAQNGGSIVHIGSINGAQGLPEVGVYGPTKAALEQLTKVQAIEWQPYNIRVNCIAPGFMDTQLTKPLQADPQRSSWIKGRVPQQRFGRPEELGGVVQLLASNAGSFITGQTIYVDGGFTAGSDWRK